MEKEWPDITDAEFAEHIYTLVCGEYRRDLIASIPESDIVANEFSENSACSKAYDRMLAAYTRICNRLGVREWDDPDVEVIISELRDIGQHTSLKMFHYGFLYGSKQNPT